MEGIPLLVAQVVVSNRGKTPFFPFSPCRRRPGRIWLALLCIAVPLHRLTGAPAPLKSPPFCQCGSPLATKTTSSQELAGSVGRTFCQIGSRPRPVGLHHATWPFRRKRAKFRPPPNLWVLPSGGIHDSQFFFVLNVALAKEKFFFFSVGPSEKLKTFHCGSRPCMSSLRRPVLDNAVPRESGLRLASQSVVSPGVNW